jgi:hypothetical protein
MTPELEFYCKHCGRSFTRRPKKSPGGPPLYCSKTCATDSLRGREKSKRGVNFRSVHPSGYVIVECPPEFREMASNGKNLDNRVPGKVLPMPRVPEHRLVVAKIIGRPLKREEIVHHKDLNKGNNSPENLVLLASEKDHGRYAHGDIGVIPVWELDDDPFSGIFEAGLIAIS